MKNLTKEELKKLNDPFESEEFKKWLEEYRNYISNIQWNHGMWENNILLEQDEQGTYGYKVLIRTPESPWFWSPNRYWNSEWLENHLTAHTPPFGMQMSGIYATKNFAELEGWYKNYLAHFATTAQVVPVKIQVWGVVIEHTKGFRAEHAEIVEILDGHW